MTHPTGPPPETREEPVKSFSLVTEILGGPQAETVSEAFTVGKGGAAWDTELADAAAESRKYKEENRRETPPVYTLFTGNT